MDETRSRTSTRWPGWVVTAFVSVLAVISVDPARVGLSMYERVAQVIAMRGLLAGCLLLAAALLLCCALLVRHRGEQRPTRIVVAVGVLVAVAAAHAVVVLSRGMSTSTALPQHKPADAIDVLSFNTWGGATGDRDVAKLIDTYAADVVALPETSARSARAIAELTARDYAVFIGQSKLGGPEPTALLVATSLGAYERIDGPNIDYGMVGAKPADHTGPVLYAVHAVSPVGEQMPTWRSDLALLTNICNTTKGVIMAGDFNATLDHQAMRATSCIDGSVDSGGVGTWPAGFAALLSAPIDHVLVDPAAWTPTASTAATRPNSDHRAIVVRLIPAP